MSLDTCREVAARIWCDKEFEHVVMDVDVCETIAQMLFRTQNGQMKSQLLDRDANAAGYKPDRDGAINLGLHANRCVLAADMVQMCLTHEPMNVIPADQSFQLFYTFNNKSPKAATDADKPLVVDQTGIAEGL